jgi:hypothetical protein
MRVVASGLGAAVAAGALAGAAVVGTGALFAALLVMQIVVVLAWVAYTDAPSPVPTLVILAGGAVAADVLALRSNGRGVSATVGVLAATFLVAVAASLADRHRSRVSESFAITVTGALLVVFSSQLLAVAAGRRGGDVVAVGLTAVGSALAVARILDVVAPRPSAVPGSGRGLVGVGVGLVVAAAAGAALGSSNAPLSTGSGLVLAFAAAAAALVADLAVELGTHAAVDTRSLGAARPLTALVPLCAAAPVTYALARLLVA